jgi:diguanylate cyclase (GGDEF)-like protein/PAS domain S-box-containing protein
VESVGDFAIFSMKLDGTIQNWNPGAEQVFGYPASEIVGRDFGVLFSPQDVAGGHPLIEMRRAAMHGSVNLERWLLRKDGSRFLGGGKLSELRRDVTGGTRGFVSIIHDATAQHAAGEELRRRAQYDDLTDVPNRRTFYEHLQRAIVAMKRRSSNAYAVLFIDLDRFKAVNDKFGHFVADHLLAVTARRLEHCVRFEDIVARVGGDEFAVLLNGINGCEDAYDAAERIGVQTRQPVSVDGREVRASVSIGIAIGDLRYEQPEHVLRDADLAMFSAKLEGRSRAVLYDSSAHAAGKYADLTLDLRNALDRNELRIAYQPIVRLADLSLAGFETLVRWEHPLRGLLLPPEFIPKAEDSQIILDIDRWMLTQSCRQLARWRTGGIDSRLQISVNVSSREFSRGDFVADVRTTLDASGLTPTALRVEITESLLMENSDTVSATMDAIRALGVAIDVDDFGTGFSSLGALTHMHVDALKIDASFIAQMDSHNGGQLLETIVGLAHKLNSVVIAEGVESAAQARRLRALGCEFAQGLFFAPPLDAEAAGLIAVSGSVFAKA